MAGLAPPAGRRRLGELPTGRKYTKPGGAMQPFAGRGEAAFGAALPVERPGRPTGVESKIILK